MTRNRCRIARKNAGLSIAQAALLLGMTTDDILRTEELDSAATENASRLADVYGVNVEWLLGEAERYDYAAVDRINGADKLLFRDRDIIAEFVASMPRRDKEQG